MNNELTHEYCIETGKSIYEYDTEVYCRYHERPFSPEYVGWLEKEVIKTRKLLEVKKGHLDLYNE